MSRLQTYAQLVRLPNLPSALSNICLGALAAGALPGRWLPFVLLLLASACLYCGGMVWNDYFDRAQDKVERPTRPIPSGLIGPAQAARLGTLLLTVGVLFAALAGWSQAGAPPVLAPKPATATRAAGQASTPTGPLADRVPANEGAAKVGSASSAPVVVALLLVAAILLYDGPLKHTPVGPVAMGLCRLLNVLLGASAAGGELGWPFAPLLAIVVGLYVAGVTWFARTEARQSQRSALRGAAAVMLASLLLALPLPATVEEGASSPLFPYLLVALGFAVGLPVCRAIANPLPAPVQAAVKRALMALIALDAVLACAVVGTMGLAILVLLVPALALSRRRALYAT